MTGKFQDCVSEEEKTEGVGVRAGSQRVELEEVILP